MPECNTELLQEIFDRGLSSGLGEVGGQVCIEAAIALACGEPFSDRPTCVAVPDRTWAIKINDSPWSSPEARAKALLPLALAQLGTAGKDRSKWTIAVINGIVLRAMPKALRSAAKSCPEHSEDLLIAAQRWEDRGPIVKAIARGIHTAYAAADAAALAANAVLGAVKQIPHNAPDNIRDEVLQEAVNIALEAYACGR